MNFKGRVKLQTLPFIHPNHLWHSGTLTNVSLAITKNYQLPTLRNAYLNYSD